MAIEWIGIGKEELFLLKNAIVARIMLKSLL